MKDTMNPVQFRVFQSSSWDPFENLAIEEYLFSQSMPREHILLFYRNVPCVILGRFQNPWKECRPTFLMRWEIPLLRRISGGGAVYQDQGNLNFSVITDRDRLSKEEYISGIQQGLISLGVKTRCENTNSIMVDRYKISGNAYRFSKNRVLYHGTMLVRASLRLLRECLIPALENGSCAGETRSRRLPVRNLKHIIPGITVWKVIQALAAGFTKQEKVRPENVQEKVSRDLYHTLVEKNRSHEWVYGQTPGKRAVEKGWEFLIR